MFKVKAVYEYSSPHEDDLSFPLGQIITVIEEEDADWYVGEYIDDSGTKHDGLFPRNFVEKYEPEPPPRPNRASRHKPLEQPAAQVAPPTPEIPQQGPEPVERDEPEPPKPAPAPIPAPVEIPQAAPKSTPMSPASPPSAASVRSPEPPQEQPQAPKPAPAAPAAKKAPPPVAAKSNAFRDRIAAFNQPAASPIQPFKPSGAPSNFIKKPFVAPPPSRNAYVPPPRDTPQVKTYRREEDPEIAERQAQDQENAEKAGLGSHGAPPTNEGEDPDQPKPTSLKERIALLQKQQQEQAQRAAALHKEKPKKPPMKKRTESHEGRHEAVADDSEDPGLERVASGGTGRERGSMDHVRSPRGSHDIRSPDSQHPNRELLSDANDADQSGAGETEDAEGTSTSVEDDDERAKSKIQLPRAAAAPLKEPDVGDEQDVEEEEEEEDEMDAETRRKLELRERMAKMSGGMGMAGMFGGMPMGGLPPKKKKSVPEKKSEEPEEYSAPQQRVAMFPMPGMPSVRSPEIEDRQLAVEKEDAPGHPFTDARSPDEVPEVEDITPQPVQRTLTGERRPVPPPVPNADRPAPPPVPSGSRPAPPAHLPIRSPSPGSESGDELTDAPAQSAASPRMPPAAPAAKRNSYQASDELDSPDRAGRPPPIPSMRPTSPSAARPPPPPPPTSAPPSRQSTMEVPPRKIDRTEGETDYEGDYDTDIAPGATHKDALKAHIRDASMDDSTIADEPSSARSPVTPQAPPPLPPSATRGAPPPPPQQAPSRPSMDAPRGVPPLPPVPPPRNDEDDDDEYDPYKYSAPPAPRSVPPTPRAAPPPPQSQPPPPQNRPPPPTMPPMPPSIPPVPQHQAAESSDEDDLYSSPPPRKSHDRPPPPPPQAPPHTHRPPPPPQDRFPPPPPPQERAAPPPPPPQDRPAPPPPPQEPAQSRPSMSARKSLDVNRTLQGRTSMDQPRPASQEFIASDIDLGTSSHWWTQPQMPPPSLQSRKDVLVDMDEAHDGGAVEKVVYVLYMDYSQTIVSARFDPGNVSSVQLEQRHEPPPPRLRQDQLEQAHEQFGVRISKDVESKQGSVVGNGTPHGLIDELLKPYQDVLPPVSTRAFGALVYANLANASIQQYDEIRPGDIITFRNARFQGKHGAMHAKYSVDVGKPDHVGVVIEWDGSKKKVRAWEQGRESKKVKPESFRMGDLRSGEVRVWRVMGKSWIGWS